MNILHITDTVETYFVESPSLPMVSLKLTFRAGDAFDPDGQEGVSYLTAKMLLEGTEKYTSEAFKKALQDKGIRLGSGTDTLNFSVQLSTLAENEEEAFDLLTEALHHPRFDAADFQRLKDHLISSLKQEDQQPTSLLRKAFDEAYYGDHPYGKTATVASVESLTLDDVKRFYATYLTQKNLVVSVVGDIRERVLKKRLKTLVKPFAQGDVRASIDTLPPVPEARLVRIQKDIPQTHVLMGYKGIDRHDPDYFAAYLASYILGGGGFASRFMEEVREKRGLAYHVYSYFEPMPHYGRFIAGVQTNNTDADTSVHLMKAETRKIAEQGITEEEFEDAKRYLIGSFPLRLSSNKDILNYLAVMQMEELGADYLETWTDKIEALTLADIQRVCQRLFRADDFLIVMLGGEA